MSASRTSDGEPPHASRPSAGPDCFACRAFFVTHESPLRYGCRFFAMKTAVLPSLAVLRSSGEPCRAFAPKRQAGR